MVRNWRQLLLGAVTGAMAIAPAGAQRPGAVRLPGFLAAMPLDSSALVEPMPGSAGAVFFATRQVLFELGIPMPMVDSAHGYIVNGRFIKMRSLAGRPLSAYLNCGSGMTGPNADAFRVTMAIAAFMDSTGPSSSRLKVTLLAGAESVEGVSKSAMACGSHGVLENRIIESVRRRVRR